MIDLRKRGLPNTISVGGKPFFINTDFRNWLKYGEWLKQGEHARLIDIMFLFPDEKPICYTCEQAAELYKELLKFYTNPNATPTGGGESDVVLDYILDGEYIYSSFMQVYGIDLTEVDMHWHKFKALFASLPDDCKIMRIMKYRSYKKTNRSQDGIYEEQKRIWALPKISPEDLDKVNKEINDEFYNT